MPVFWSSALYGDMVGFWPIEIPILSVSSNVPILEKMSQIIVRRVVVSHVLRTPIRDIQAHITRNNNKPCSFLPDKAYSFRMPTPV